MFKIDFDVAESKITKLEGQLDSIAKKSSQVSRNLESAANAASPEYDRLKKSLQQSQTELEKLKNSTKQTGQSTESAAKSTKKLVDQNKKMAGQAGRTRVEVEKLNNAFWDSSQAAAGFRAFMNASGTHMGIFTGHTIATATAVYGLVSALKNTVTIGIDFTGQMTRAIPIMGATSAEAQLLEKEVRRLGESTQFTATEAAAGLTALGMAGLSTAQAYAALEPTLNLSAIGMIDMYKSADIITNVMTGFRMEAEETRSIVDDLATAITSSNATIEQMASALSYVAPVAQAAGGEIEEVTAMLEVFHNAGIKGSRAGTSLRRAYANLQAPSEKAAEAIKTLGVETSDINGSMLELSDIMDQLAENGATSADMITIFGVRAAPAMIALLNDMKGVNSQFEKFRSQLEDNENASQKLREKTENNLGTDLKKLMSALQEQGIKMFQVWEDGLREMTQGMTEFVNSVDPESVRLLAESIANTATALKVAAQLAITYGAALGTWKLVGIVAGLTNLVKAQSLAAVNSKAMAAGALMSASAQGKYSKSTNLATKATMALNLAIRANPLGMLVTGLTAAATAIYLFSDSEEEATEQAKKHNKVLEDQIQNRAELRKINEEALKYSQNKGKSSGDKVENQYLEDMAKQQKIITDSINAINLAYEDNIVEFSGKSQKKNQEFYAIAKTLNQEIKDATGAYEELNAQLDYYRKTGLTPAGLKLQQQYTDELIKMSEVSLDDSIDEAFQVLDHNLKQLKSNTSTGNGTIIEQMIGSKQEINAAIETVTDAYNAKIQPLLETIQQGVTKRGSVNNVPIFNKADTDAADQLLIKIKDPAWEAQVVKTKEAVEAMSQYRELTEALAESMDKLKEKKAGVNTEFDKYINAQDKLQVKGKRAVETLMEEIKAINGSNESKKSKIELELEAAKATNEALIASEQFKKLTLEQQEAIKGEVSEYEKLIAAIALLRQEKLKAQDDADILKSYKQGKGLDRIQQIQQEYDMEIELLEKYQEKGLEIRGGYAERVKELEKEKNLEIQEYQDETMIREHKMWFDLMDNAAESIGDNIAKVALLDQSWSEAGKNIRRAIVGGIVGALAEMAVKETTMFIARMFMQEKEAVVTAQSEAMKTSTVVANSATRTAAYQSEAMAAGMTQAWNPVTAALTMATMAMMQAFIQSIFAQPSGGTREIGGPVMSGASYLVGEKGPEIFTPSVTGQITSNADIKRKMAGDDSKQSEPETVQVVQEHHYHINAVDARSFKQLVNSDIGYIAQRVNKINQRQGKFTTTK